MCARAIFPAPTTSIRCERRRTEAATLNFGAGTFAHRCRRRRALPCSRHMIILAPAGFSEPNRPESLDFVQLCSEAGSAAGVRRRRSAELSWGWGRVRDRYFPRSRRGSPSRTAQEAVAALRLLHHRRLPSGGRGSGRWRGYEWWETKKAAEAGAAFEQAVILAEAGKHQEAEAAFAKLATDGTAGYRLLARLREAADSAQPTARPQSRPTTKSPPTGAWDR